MKTNEVILVGDVGGTNVRFGLARRGDDERLHIDAFQKIRGDDVASFEAALDQFLEAADDKPKHACFALAGPITNGEVLLTNRPWLVSEETLKTKFGFSGIRLINDFAAMARSVPEEDEGAFETVRLGTPQLSAPILVAGAGTGFGVATLVQVAGRWHVCAGEGGHVAYAPHTREECELLCILTRKYGYVSLELVCSGSGMDRVHEAVCERQGKPYARLTPAQVAKNALDGDSVCAEVCSVRSNAIMGAVGDNVLTMGARGGAVLAGGVSERMINFLKAPAAISRFKDRGAMSAYMNDIPITLLAKPDAPLIGAAAAYLDQIR